MSEPLRLTVSTPSRVLVDVADVTSFRASDSSGSFGIQPGHADFLTVIPASVIAWREGSGEWQYCAVRGGVLSVTRGQRIALACRQGVLGTDLASLEAEVHKAAGEETEADKRARVEQTRLHAQAVRQLVQYLAPRRRGAGFARQDEAEV